MSLARPLAAGLSALGLSLDAIQQQKLLDYLALIAKWNKVYNLTAVREPEAMLTQHLLDSLAVLPHLHATRVIDVGSGAGLPGIPFAIARPEWKIALLDSNHKKATFLRQACLELGLTNTEVVCERVEQYQPSEKFNTVISRAFSDLGEFARLTAHLAAKDGKLYAMKGVYPHDELGRLPPQFKAQEVIPLTVPGMDASRHLVIMGVEEQ
ncbi:MAG: 16S rRNA (guanine(527)-N(7))-methyltransferase RsmG [Burkholderiales bacterium]